MKSLIQSILIAGALVIGGTTAFAAEKETVRVCVDVMKDGKPVKDAKGNVKQNCKEMKVHKKLEGTKVPEKK